MTKAGAEGGESEPQARSNVRRVGSPRDLRYAPSETFLPPDVSKWSISRMGARLVEQYQRQARWRRWSEALALLPLERGQRVLDLGCGVGEIAEQLRELGAEVVGVDANEELLLAARLSYPDIHFKHADLRELAPETVGVADGIWSSFVAAYFPDLAPTLARWSACLRPGGWMALVEMDDLFGHEPFPNEFRADVARFYQEAKRAGRYDFQAGRKLASAACAIGLELLHETVLADDELSFAGPAKRDVLDAWRNRLNRMGGLKAFLGDRFTKFEEAFTATLRSENHSSRTRVIYVIARRNTDGLSGS
jgi:trans-aconitate methyltransferase